MTQEEQTEYQGLAVAVGRFAMALKEIEAQLALARDENAALRAQLAETERRREQEHG